MKIILVSIFLIVTSVSCTKSSDATPNTEPQPSNRLFINGKIFTVNKSQPWAEAVYVEKGIIKFVGKTDAARKAAAQDAEVIDLQGKLMMPGIHDVHMHPLEAKSPFAGTCLLDSEEEDAEKFIEVLDECQDEQLATDWVLGAGYSVATLLNAERDPIEILDEAIPDRPAVIMEETSHSVWVNSKALELAKIDKDSPNPVGGVIVKDKETGEPTGVLFDSAGDIFMDLAWLPKKEIRELNYQGLLEALETLNENGITSAVEARTYWKRDFQDAWLRAEKEGKLTVRAVLDLWAYPAMDDKEQIQKLKSLYKTNPNGLVQISGIKVYSDGILINSTAALLAPYKTTLGEIPFTNGLNYFTEERLAKYIAELEPVGFDFNIHVIGDRAARESLNAIEKSQKGKGRHRLTHLEMIDKADIDRFKKLNVTADFQVVGEYTQPENWKENEYLIGERATDLIPIKSVFDTGARVTLSSDWDVSDINPFIGIQNAVTRTPQNLPDVEAAVRAYTINAAYVMRQEDRTGSIEVGKQGDLIILDQNIFEIPSEKISATQVLFTFLAGKKVFEKK